MRKKVYSILLCVCLLISVCLVKEYNPMEGGNNLLDDTVTLHVWYTDEALTDYINSAALYYSEENDGVRVVPALTTGLEYLEQINESSINGEGICDVYIVSNDLLGKAYLSGLAAEIKDEENVISTDNFPKAALDAVTYQ